MKEEIMEKDEKMVGLRDELERLIGYTFRNRVLLELALTHSSYANDKKAGRLKNNERLEFLGDAVLELVTSEELYNAYSDRPEGELTKIRARIVCEPTIAMCANDISLGKFLRLGRGEENTGGRKRDSIISDAMEALIGAIYLDSGLEPARAFIKKYILQHVKKNDVFFDSKTTLQELMQKHFKDRVEYILTGESGPDHDKNFSVSVIYEGRVLGKGEGKTKKSAEQQAAYEAILNLRLNGRR